MNEHGSPRITTRTSWIMEACVLQGRVDWQSRNVGGKILVALAQYLPPLCKQRRKKDAGKSSCFTFSHNDGLRSRSDQKVRDADHLEGSNLEVMLPISVQPVDCVPRLVLVYIDSLELFTGDSIINLQADQCSTVMKKLWTLYDTQNMVWIWHINVSKATCNKLETRDLEFGFSQLTQIKDEYTTNSHYLTYRHFSLGRLGECTFWTWEWKGQMRFKV